MNLYQKILKRFKNSKYQNSLQALREERGAIFVLTALLLPLLLGCLGFAYDAGNLYMHKARLQNTADAAALAGARAFVDEAASQRKTLRTQYMNNNNVTTIPTDISNEINDTVKTEAKTAAKNAAVANVTKNMVNLHNDYQSKYYLVTGRITESGKNYEQQYFKANLEETVPLYFIPILLNKRDQDVAAEAISTIINKGTGSGGNNQQRKKFGPESLFMVKDGFSMEGDGFYNDGSGNTDNTPKKAPTWNNDYFEGDLRYTDTSVNAFFGNKNNLYSGNVPFDRVFNKKALELMTALKKLMNEYNQDEYNNFIAELQKHPDFYSDGAYTEKGRVLVEKLETMKPGSGVQYDHAFWGAYGAFYEELASNENYYRKFEKLDNYNMDQFGDAIKALFKRKLAAEQGISEETYRAQWQEAHDAWVTTTSDGGEWKTAHDTWQTNHNTWQAAENTAKAAAQAQIDEMVANGGGSGETVFNPKSATPQEVYNKIKQYTDLYKEWSKKTSTERAGEKYIAEDKTYFGIDNVSDFLNIANNINFDDSWTSWNDVDGTDWRWGPLKQGYQNYLAGGGQDNLTPKGAYEKLLEYKAMQVWNYYETSLMAEVANDNDLKPYNLEFWQIRDLPVNNENVNWQQIGNYNDSDFNSLSDSTKYWLNQIKSKYQNAGGDIEVTSSTPSIPTVEQLMASWYADPANAEPQEPPMPDEPQIENYIQSTNGDEYYAQYHGSSYEFTASGISKIPPSKEHSYFYHPAADGFGGGFTLTIDSEGFYTDDNITTETPFYLFIGDALTASVINIILEADVNRPLIFCYMGNKNTQIHIQLNGHTFQGIIYTPNSYGSEVHMNVNGDGGTVGTFKGSWMSKEITLKQASSHFEYEEYYLEPSLQKAMPNYDSTQQEEYSGGDDTVDEDLADKNPIKVIKLVKSVADILSVEEIN